MEPWFAWWHLLLFEKQVGWWSWTFSKTLLLMTSLNFAFAEGSCSLFSQVALYFVSNSKVDQLSRQQKKKKCSGGKKKKRKTYLSFTSHSLAVYFYSKFELSLVPCVKIYIKYQRKKSNVTRTNTSQAHLWQKPQII